MLTAGKCYCHKKLWNNKVFLSDTKMDNLFFVVVTLEVGFFAIHRARVLNESRPCMNKYRSFQKTR